MLQCSVVQKSNTINKTFDWINRVLEDTAVSFVARPKSPRISCGPQTHVLQNTTVTCTCSTPSLGQPAGSLRLVIGNKTTQQTAARQEKQEISSRELLYSHVLSLSDHSSTWFRCDLLWGTEEIRGQNYTASVGCKQSFFVNISANFKIIVISNAIA